MTTEELKVRCRSLATVNDAQAVATLKLIAELEARENEPIETGKTYVTLPYLEEKLSGMMAWVETYVQSNAIMGSKAIVEHTAEVAAYDKRAKEYYAKIVNRLWKLANACRSKGDQLSPPGHSENATEALIKHFEDYEDYVTEYAKLSKRCAFLEDRFARFTGVEAPRTPDDWDPGESPKPQPKEPERAINRLRRQWTLGRWGYGNKPKTLTVDRAVYTELLEMWKEERGKNLVCPEFDPDIGYGLKWRGIVIVEGPIVPEIKDQGGNPEETAIAATRKAQGLPRETDPGAISVDQSRPAARWDKTDKMGNASGNKGD